MKTILHALTFGLLICPLLPATQVDNSAARPIQRPTQSARTASGQALLSQADSVLKIMSRLTGLPIKAPLKKELVNRAGIRQIIKAKLRSDYSPVDLEQQQATLQAFGLVGADFDLAKFLEDFYTEQAAGFYDPRTKTMYIADWVKPDQQRMVLDHELTHALQDQNFNLQNYLRAVKDNDDASAARLAVVEGYATAAMIQELIGSVPLGRLPSMQPFMAMAIHQDRSEFPVYASAPFFFRFQSLFPYSQGLNFIQKDLARSNWQSLSQLFTQPPETTQQIFDPALYFSHGPALHLDLPHPPAPARKPEMRKIKENTFGELGYYCLLGQLISEDEAKSLAPAWVEDRYAVYQATAGQPLALIARTVWATRENAAQFFKDYQAILRKKYGAGLKAMPSPPHTFVAGIPQGEAVVILKGSQCVLGDGISKKQRAVFEKWASGLKDQPAALGNKIASAP
jgi:hypothetical protein